MAAAVAEAVVVVVLVLLVDEREGAIISDGL